MASDPDSMRIGALAKRTGRSVHTIRWYEAQRLIPGVRRDPQGRRIYGEAHVGWIELLDRLRTIGLSIRQMREFVVLTKKGESTLDDRRLLMETHRERAVAEMKRLAESIKLIDEKIDFYRSWIKTGKRPATVHDSRKRDRA